MRTELKVQEEDGRERGSKMTRVAIEAREVLARAVQCYEAATSSPEAVNALKAEMLAVTSRCRR